MGYLKQKKRQANIRRFLNMSLAVLDIFCLLILFWKENDITKQISPWFFQIYIFTLVMIVYAAVHKFYLQASGMLLCLFVFFLNIGMGGNIFLDIKTQGTQNLNILYDKTQGDINHVIKEIKEKAPDIGIILSSDAKELKVVPFSKINEIGNENENIIISKYPYSRSGEVLLSPSSRIIFMDTTINSEKMTLMALDFSQIKKNEQKMAFTHLAEFINMQDVPIIIIGDFKKEAWSKEFLDFLETTKLEVKNRILLYRGNILFNPFVVSSLNILAYKDFGIKNISFLPIRERANNPMLVELNY